ncbi:MAG: anaerobic glycerol-3-phosphate dehydrogenase subunit GlpB [Actinomycetota bacterium]|nr:anaerobic glycerol-3-phosphate dehydrogenase subunit GlpB [Actinomycetota bacterium]
MRADTVVIGAGLAGLTCALRLAEEGRKVAVVATGAGSLHLGGATIDILGYDPDPVTSPAAALGSFIQAQPEHPYARVSPELRARALEWLGARCEPLRLTGSLDRNLMLPTAVGALKPSALAPHSLAAGDLSKGGKVALVSFSALKDFYPQLAAANLNRAKAGSTEPIEARAIELLGTIGGEADPGPLRLARAFEAAAFRHEVAARLERRIEPGERVGFPAVLGLERSPEVVTELTERLGTVVFEIPTLPPSIPGLRLHALLNRALKKAGGRVVMGAPVVSSAAHGRRLEAVSTATGARRRSSHEARDFVVATGGVSAGGVTLDSSWDFKESALALPLAGVPPQGTERFCTDVFGSHPASRVGVATDDEWRPLDSGGRVVYDNVRVCGATLAGAEPHREKSGNGISLVTGYAVSDAILRS